MTTGHSLPNQGGTAKRTKPSSLTVMGGEGFFYLRLLKKLPCSVLGRSTPSTYCGKYASGIVLPAALPVERRVSARRGWVGENGGLFEHPDGSVKEEKPWNG
ncbi:MAG: hypothetical protein AABY94_02985 [Nitrospirota bacterium]